MATNGLYDNSTPYYSTNVVENYLDIMVNRPIPKYSDDPTFIITPTYEYRPDLLAYDLYKNSKLWWVFAQRNPNTLVNPLYDFKVGTKIFLPKKSTLTAVLGA
jgi:hypothetical protein